MQRFIQLFYQLDETTSTNAKVARLKDYFLNSNPKVLAWSVTLLTGRRRRRWMTSLRLKEVLLTHVDMPEWLYKESHAHVGDGSETIALLLKAFLKNRNVISLKTLAEWMEEEFPKLVRAEETVRNEMILSWWRGLQDDDFFVFNKILTGGFRIGVSEKLVFRALSQALEVPVENIAHQLMGIKQVETHHLQSLCKEFNPLVQISQPYPFFLAHLLEEKTFSSLNPEDWLAEWKWDGIRCQIIRRQGQSFIWSRGEELINKSFPDLLEHSKYLPDGTVIDGEILVWREGVESFNALQRRLGRKKPTEKIQKDFPVQCLIFDVLEWQSQDQRRETLKLRRQILEELKTYQLSGFQFSESLTFNSPQDLESLRDQARKEKAEGLMLKRLDSPYGVGRKRGAWWKYKVVPYTLDAVLLYAQAGSGRRANLFTDYTFALQGEDDELVSFAKAYSGLNQEEINELDRWIRRNTTEKYGPARAVEAVQVFEIAFEGIFPSKRHKSGLAVRFPRIIRWRKDIKPSDINTVEDAKRLIDCH